jgi:hypothetical protein
MKNSASWCRLNGTIVPVRELAIAVKVSSLGTFDIYMRTKHTDLRKTISWYTYLLSPEFAAS